MRLPRITESMVNAFEDRDPDALHRLLGWHSWQPSPLHYEPHWETSHLWNVREALAVRQALMNAVAARRRQRMRRRK